MRAQPLVDARSAAEAHSGVDVVLAVPLDALELPVFRSDWLRAVSGFYVCLCHPALTSACVALLYAFVDVPQAGHLHVARLGDTIVDRPANGQVAHRDGSVLGCFRLDATRGDTEAF